MSAAPRPTSKQRLRESLARLDPAPAVFADDEDLKPFETDGFIVRRATPLLAVLPDTEAQVGDVVRLCRAAGVPVVTRGAGTGVSGGAIPREDGVLLVVSKMRRVEGCRVSPRKSRMKSPCFASTTVRTPARASR
jgi:glycolate oxidase